MKERCIKRLFLSPHFSSFSIKVFVLFLAQPSLHKSKVRFHLGIALSLPSCPSHSSFSWLFLLPFELLSFSTLSLIAFRYASAPFLFTGVTVRDLLLYSSSLFSRTWKFSFQKCLLCHKCKPFLFYLDVYPLVDPEASPVLQHPNHDAGNVLGVVQTAVELALSKWHTII